MTSTGQSAPTGCATMEFLRSALLIFISCLIAFIIDDVYSRDVGPDTMTGDTRTDGCESTANMEEQGERMTGNELLPHMVGLTTVLYQSQYEAAKFFEIAYYSVSNFPDLAVEVRLSAHQARTSHELSVSLMKKFAVTGSKIVDSVIPRIIQAVDLGNDKIVRNFLNMIIKWSENMQKEAEDTRKRYLDLQHKLQTDIELIRKKRNDVKTEREDMTQKMKQEQHLVKEAQRVQEELENEKRKTEKELEELQNVRRTLSQSEGAGGNLDSSYLGVAMAQGMGWAGAAMACVTYIWKGLTQDRQSENMMKMMMKTQESIDKIRDHHLQLVFESQRRNKEVIERMHTMKQFYLRDQLLGDEGTLLDAVHRLGEVDQYLAKMAEFWADMAVVIMDLMKETTLGEPYLDDLNKPDVAETFKETMGDAKKNWIHFAEVCGQYVSLSKNDPELRIATLYGFMDGRVDKMNKQQRISMMTKIQDEFIMTYSMAGFDEEANEFNEEAEP